MAAKPKRKTYAEFLSWLEGVESMQSKDWTPNTEQWRTIREMIGNLKPEIKEVKVNVPGPVQYVEQPPPAYTPPMHPPQSAFEPHPQVQHMPMHEGRGDGVPIANTTKQTEILDTSNGEYQSEFL